MNPENPDNVILAELDNVTNWGREDRLRPVFLGVSCCFLEIMTRVTPGFDLEQFATTGQRGSAHEANLLIIAGTPFRREGATILRLYEQMPHPKWVVVLGDCADNGGRYDVYSVIQGVDQIVPVDVRIPGCPPRPEDVNQGLLSLREKIADSEPASRPGAPLQDASAGPITAVRDTGQQQPGRDFSADIIPQQPKSTFANGAKLTAEQIHERFEGRVRADPESVDMPGFIATPADLPELLKYLKRGTRIKYARLEDITAIDERLRRVRPDHDFTLVYHLLSLQVPGYLRIKVPLPGAASEVASITSLWPSATWYEREVYDMFGIRFSGHPDLRRILMPPDWDGFPLRKDHVSRASDLAPFTADTARSIHSVPALDLFDGRRIEAAGENMRLTIGPHHPGTHGMLRLLATLQGEQIVDLDPELGAQHRGLEKIGERLQWHRFIPYTDRVDYLSGVQNNLAYLHSVETLLGVAIPPRAESIRILLCELFRIASHLIWLGTFAHDVGVTTMLFPAFYWRERIYDIVEMITGARMHPAWFCIGGVADDLPVGWKPVIENFSRDFDQQLNSFEKVLTDGPIFRPRTEGLGVISSQSAVDRGLSGPNLRATGVPWDVRRSMSYSGYDRFDFDVVIAQGGDCFARYLVRMGEMRESLKIMRQAVATMPGGKWLGDGGNPLADKVNHGLIAPKGECYRAIESSKGECGYYNVSDGGSLPYRLRIRTPSFPHLQALAGISRGSQLSDLIILLDSVDFVLADLDR